MNRIFLVLLFSLFALLTHAKSTDDDQRIKYPGGKAVMYRIVFTDKHHSPYSLDRPQAFLSAKALARRKRQGLPLDSTDLPVTSAYIDSVRARGIDVVSHSKWNNSVLARVKKPQLVKQLNLLPFVADVKKVWTAPDSIKPLSTRTKYHTEFRAWDTVDQIEYGAGMEQINMLNGITLHEKGYMGRGMTIAVLDGGFMNADMIPCLQAANIVGCEDFVVPKSKTIFREMDHGTKVLSVMAANVPYVFKGTAPEAAYWLLRCEDNYTESMAEEDYWAAAAEFADSAGVDIINSSLGFHEYDDESTNYRYIQLDGHSALVSVTASMLAKKGIVLVNSAGNDGMDSWKKINVPADADDIITVGAVGPNRKNAAFCSVGPTADGRVKPDVMAMGSPATVLTGRGTIIKDMGTSFSTPVVTGLVACLWQALPTLKATDIIDIVRKCADNYATPDNIYGYGIPDFKRALSLGKALLSNRQQQAAAKAKAASTLKARQ